MIGDILGNLFALAAYALAFAPFVALVYYFIRGAMDDTYGTTAYRTRSELKAELKEARRRPDTPSEGDR